MLIGSVRFEEFQIDDLCDYIDDKYYKPLVLNFNLLKNYLEKSNLHEKDNDNAHGIVRILVDKLIKESQLLFKNDTLIFFPKIKNNITGFSSNTLSIFSNIHFSILEIIERIKVLLNYYIPEPFWNVQTHLLVLELKHIEHNFENIIFIKENYLWTKIKSETIVN